MKETTVPAKAEKKAPETREESRTLTPAVDIFEVNGGLAVIVDLPGVAKEDVQVHVEDDILTIAGKPKSGIAAEQTHTEYELAPYFRQFQLGEHVDQEKIHADAKYGVVTIHLPKVEKAKPKKITVNVQS